METMRPPYYHHNGFVVTHALGHMIYGYTLLVTVKQRVHNKLDKESNISPRIKDLQNTECSNLAKATYEPLYYPPCLVCCALFGSLVLVMCNCTSCA